MKKIIVKENKRAKNPNFNVIFIGTSSFAVPILNGIIRSSFLNLAYIITAPDKPAGRKRQLTPSPIKQFCLKHKLLAKQPLKIAELITEIKKNKPDLIILAGYGQFIPAAILKIPAFGCLNLHPSLLPKYRGPSPIQTAILNNEKNTGLTIILMDEQMDHGPIIGQKKIKISQNQTYQDLEQKIARLGTKLLIEILPDWFNRKIKPRGQKHPRASFTRLLSRDDGQVDPKKQSAEEMARKVKAYYPWPGTWLYLNKQRVKIIKAKAVAKQQATAIPAGRGFLRLDIVQPAGKKPMTGEEYFRGH